MADSRQLFNSAPEMLAALEQIKTVCDDNEAATVRHDLALKFVRDVAVAAIAKATAKEISGERSGTGI